MRSADAPGEQFPLWNRIRMGDRPCSLITGYFILAIFALDVSQQTNVTLFAT